MNIDEIADAHLKPAGRALPEDDELRLVGKMIDAAVREYMGGQKPPTPLAPADMKAVAEIMAKCATEAVRSELSALREQLAILSDTVSYLAAQIATEKASDTPAKAKPKPPSRLARTMQAVGIL